MSSNKLCLGLSSDYTVLDTSTSTFSDTFSPATTSSSALGALGGMGVGIGYLGARAPQPLSVQLPDNQILLVKDTLSAFLDSDGRPIERRQIPWKDSPEKIGWTYPYLIVVTSKGVGVWNPERGKLVQRIDLQGLTLLNDGKLLYVANNTHVWRLVPYTYDSQVDELVEQKLYDEAISLLTQVDEVLLKNKVAPSFFCGSLISGNEITHRSVSKSIRTIRTEKVRRVNGLVLLCLRNPSNSNKSLPTRDSRRLVPNRRTDSRRLSPRESSRERTPRHRKSVYRQCHPSRSTNKSRLDATIKRY